MNRLKILREQNGKTQKDVAKYLGITEASFSQLENGKRKLTEKNLGLLAEYFGCSTDYLLGITNDDIGIIQVVFNAKDYKPPTPKQKEQIRQIVETILDKRDE